MAKILSLLVALSSVPSAIFEICPKSFAPFGLDLACYARAIWTLELAHLNLYKLYGHWNYSLYNFKIRRDVTSGRLPISGEVP